MFGATHLADFSGKPWAGAHQHIMSFLQGVGLLILSGCSFALLTYWLVISKLMPPTGNAVLDWLRDDYYYCLLVPITVPVTVFAGYLSWFTNKLFRHN